MTLEKKLNSYSITKKLFFVTLFMSLLYPVQNLTAGIINLNMAKTMSLSFASFLETYSAHIDENEYGQITTWGYDAHGFKKAHEMGFTGTGVSVAVVDGGSLPHNDIQFYDGGSGMWLSASSKTRYNDVHALQVASVLGANGTMIGMIPDAEFTLYKALDGDKGNIHSILNTLEKAIDDGNDVINLSLCLTVESNPIILKYFTVRFGKIMEKARATNTIIVAGAGNEGFNSSEDNLCLFSEHQDVITVGSINSDGRISAFSSVGKNIDFVAAGENILVADINNGYTLANGTSFATPHVTALVAILKQLDPQASIDKIKSQLISISAQVGPSDLHNRYFGHGFPIFSKEILK